MGAVDVQTYALWQFIIVAKKKKPDSRRVRAIPMKNSLGNHKRMYFDSKILKRKRKLKKQQNEERHDFEDINKAFKEHETSEYMNRWM